MQCFIFLFFYFYLFVRATSTLPGTLSHVSRCSARCMRRNQRNITDCLGQSPDSARNHTSVTCQKLVPSPRIKGCKKALGPAFHVITSWRRMVEIIYIYEYKFSCTCTEYRIEWSISTGNSTTQIGAYLRRTFALTAQDDKPRKHTLLVLRDSCDRELSPVKPPYENSLISLPSSLRSVPFIRNTTADGLE